MKTTQKYLFQLLLLLVAAVPILAQEKSTTQKFEREGVEIEFTIEPVKEPGAPSEVMEAKEATVRFKINDKASKTALSGVKPSVWLAQRDGDANEQQIRLAFGAIYVDR